MGLRFILTALVVCAVVVILRHPYRRRNGSRGITRRPSVDMVQCAHCGVHLPRPEAIREGDRYFCSEEHRRLESPEE